MHILLSNRSFNNLFLDKMRDKIYIYSQMRGNFRSFFSVNKNSSFYLPVDKKTSV
jgi:hypothetical protein